MFVAAFVFFFFLEGGGGCLIAGGWKFEGGIQETCGSGAPSGSVCTAILVSIFFSSLRLASLLRIHKIF